jgi:hypothetical protein
MAGVIFLFFSILVGMWVFARIMYPTRGRLPLPNQDAPAKPAEVEVGLAADRAVTSPALDKPEQTQDSNSLICATCGKTLTREEAITQAGVHFCSAEHLIDYQQSN